MALFNTFFFISDFLKFEYNMLRYWQRVFLSLFIYFLFISSFLLFFLSILVVSELPGSVMMYLTLISGNSVVSTSNNAPAPVFLLHLEFPIIRGTVCTVIPQVLGIIVGGRGRVVFFNLIYFSTFEVPIVIFSNTKILSLSMFSLPINILYFTTVSDPTIPLW